MRLKHELKRHFTLGWLEFYGLGMEQGTVWLGLGSSETFSTRASGRHSHVCCLPRETTDLSPSRLNMAAGQLISGLSSPVSWYLSLRGYRRWPGHHCV